jgi:hypothetical protein
MACGTATSRATTSENASALQTYAFKRPFDPHEEEPLLVVSVLIGVEDVGLHLVEESGHSRDEPSLVGAIDEKRCRICHAEAGTVAPMGSSRRPTEG